MYYAILILISLIFSLLFELNIFLLLVVVAVYVLCVPRIMENQKKRIFEEQRFCDINSYMSQMAQSFIYTKDVIQSLEETFTCFASGLMQETLKEALELLEAGKWDIKRAQRDALDIIESRYDCEKLRNLHNFFMNAEELGGNCHTEFKILENMRISWQGVVESIRVRRVWERNIGILIYGFFLIICVVMLHIMRGSNLDIVKLLPTQLISTALIIGCILYFLLMDNRLTKSLLISSLEMDEKTANEYFSYLENYDEKREQKKYRSFVCLAVGITVFFVYMKPTWIALALGMCLIFVSSQVHTLIHLNAVQTIRAEVAKAFPKWLFDVMLLLQRESVEGALEHSLETAPAVLKREIYHMSELLLLKPHDPEAYLSFLSEYKNQGIDEFMRKLYSLAVGSNRDSEVLEVVMEKNIKNLEKSERDSMLLRDGMKSFTWIPFLCVGFGCIGYLVIAIMTSINEIIELVK